MKLRQLLVIILVVGLLVVYYILGTGYRQQRHKNAELAAQITAAAEQLALIPAPPANIEQQQATANFTLNKELNSFPDNINSTQIVNAILKLAEAAGVKAIPMATQPMATEGVNGINYPVFRLNIAVKGTLAQLTVFLSRLETGEPGTLVVSNLAIDRVLGASANETETGNNFEIEGSLDIAVFARPSITARIDKVE
jgi:hypothetical protein